MTGWAAGAGVDYAATDNVIVRLEYRYTDYGHKDFSVELMAISALRLATSLRHTTSDWA